MPNQKHPSKKDILAQWEKLVALHTRWKNDPSVQCALSIAKLVIKLLLWLFRDMRSCYNRRRHV